MKLYPGICSYNYPSYSELLISECYTSSLTAAIQIKNKIIIDNHQKNQLSFFFLSKKQNSKVRCLTRGQKVCSSIPAVSKMSEHSLSFINSSINRIYFKYYSQLWMNLPENKSCYVLPYRSLPRACNILNQADTYSQLHLLLFFQTNPLLWSRFKGKQGALRAPFGTDTTICR